MLRYPHKDYFLSSLVQLTRFIPIIHQRWPSLLNGVLLLLFCWLLAQWTWLVALPKPRQPASSSVLITTQLAAEAITLRHLFGQAAGPDTVTSAPPSAFSNLKLQGVFAAIGSLPAFAIVIVDGKSAQPVQVGREAASGVVLEEVHPDYVVLRRNGVMERLNLEKSASAPVGAGAAEFKLNIQQRGGDSFTFSRKELNTALQGAKQLGNLGRLSPYPGGGMLVDDASSGSLASKLGLQAGDVVKNFNGQPVKSNEDTQRFLQQLSQLNLARLHVMRGGAIMQLQYQILP